MASSFTFSRIFGDFGSNLFNNILSNERVLAALFFIALFVGTFAVFKGLLRFFFKDSGQFQQKERNIIALMFSFIGTSGLVFMFKGNPENFVVFFGGIGGLLILLFFSIVLMKFFISLANVYEDVKVLRIFWFAFGTALTTGMIVSYTGFVLSQLTDFKKIFENIYDWTYPFFELALIIAIVTFFIVVGRLFKGKETPNSVEDKKEIKEIRDLLKLINNEFAALKDHFDKKIEILKKLKGGNLDQTNSIVSAHTRGGEMNPKF